MKKLILALAIFAVPATAIAEEWILQITALSGLETFFTLPGSFTTIENCWDAQFQYRDSLTKTITQNGVTVSASATEILTAARTFKTACIRINY